MADDKLRVKNGGATYYLETTYPPPDTRQGAVRFYDGVRVCSLVPRQDFVQIGWIDEACGRYCGPWYWEGPGDDDPDLIARYEADKAEFEETKESLPKHGMGVFRVCNGYNRDCYGRIKPTSSDFPDGITISDCGRVGGGPRKSGCSEPTAAEFESLFEILKTEVEDDDGEVGELILSVDNSSSMYTSTIEPAYTNFKDWVELTYPEITITEKEWTDEYWIQQLIHDIGANVAVQLAPAVTERYQLLEV